MTLAFHLSIPLLGSLSGLAYPLLVLGSISIGAGLGSRLGICFDNSRLPFEKYTMLLAATTGLILAITLLATHSTAALAIAGISSFLTSAIGLPPGLFEIFFIITVSSCLISAADYMAKGMCYLQVQFAGKETEIQQALANKLHEYRGALAATIVGIVIGIVTVVSFAAFNPGVLIGPVGVVAAILGVLATTGIVGGIGSRVGRLLDGFNKQNLTIDESVTSEAKKITPADAANNQSKTKLSPELEANSVEKEEAKLLLPVAVMRK
jgi:hypothetical protein